VWDLFSHFGRMLPVQVARLEDGLGRPRGPRSRARLQLREAQARRLVHAPSAWTPLGKRDRAILETLYGTGVRRSECCRLDLMDLDLSQATLLVRNGKGRKDRLAPVPGRAGAAIDVYLRESRAELTSDTPWTCRDYAAEPVECEGPYTGIETQQLKPGSDD
jgi:site-specific recombinase XerD